MLGLVAHVAATTAGTAVGLLCARPLVNRVGWSFVIAAIVVVATAVQPWLPPVGTAAAALVAAGDPPLVSALIGVLVACLAGTAGRLVDRRR